MVKISKKMEMMLASVKTSGKQDPKFKNFVPNTEHEMRMPRDKKLKKKLVMKKSTPIAMC